MTCTCKCLLKQSCVVHVTIKDPSLPPQMCPHSAAHFQSSPWQLLSSIPLVVGSMNGEPSRSVSSTAALTKRSRVMVSMSSVASRTVWLVDAGGTLNVWSAFFPASRRNIPHRDISSMCFFVALAPAACTPSFTILNERMCVHVHLCTCI